MVMTYAIHYGRPTVGYSHMRNLFNNMFKSQR